MRQITQLIRLATAATSVAALTLCSSPLVQAQHAQWNQLNREATALYKQGNYGEAIAHTKQAISLIEKALGPDHPDIATSLNNLAALYAALGRYHEAELHHKRSLAILEKVFGPDDPFTATGISNLASVYAEQNRYAEAIPMHERALAIREKALGPLHPDVAQSLEHLASLYTSLGDYARAESIHQRALAINEKAYGPDHPNLAVGLNGLARLYRSQGQYAAAEALYMRVLAITERSFGSRHAKIAAYLNNLALLYRTQGRYGEAEPLFKRALEIMELALGLEHPNLATPLDSLAELYRLQGRSVEAEPLFKRALAVSEKARGPNHLQVARSLNNLAVLYLDLGQYAEAEALYQRSLTITEQHLGSTHTEVAKVAGNLATVYYHQGLPGKAEPYLKRATEIMEKVLGSSHPDYAVSLHNLAFLLAGQGLHAQAEPLYLQSVAISQKALGKDHPEVARSLNSLALLYIDQKKFSQALAMARQASTIYRRRIVAGGAGDEVVREAAQNRTGFKFNLMLLTKNPDGDSADELSDEAFQILQLEQASGTASAIAKMAARLSQGEDALADLIRRKQDASERRAKAETQLVKESSKLPQERKIDDEKRLRADLDRTLAEIATIDAELGRSFPQYQELTRTEPLSIKQVQALLRPTEALLVYSLGDTVGLDFLLVVRQNSALFLSAKKDAKALAERVAAIRSEMNFDSSGNPEKVSVGKLHELYQQFFAPTLPQLAGVSHVLVVPSGPLQSLPFGMLVASPPPEISSNADYRKVDWLAKHYAFSVLPSVSSIQAFRQFAKTPDLQEPFAGFGDPLIGGSGAVTRGRRVGIDIAAAFRGQAAKANTSAPVTAKANEIADVEAIRNAPRLPETADELRAMAKVLKSTFHSLWMQDDATETKIKQLDLSKYRTLAFATHGVMAGEIKGIGEPGLILTPPSQGTLEDDGYLSASEIAKLKLNADWVVLSACNTAAADGTPGAEGLSGLGKAFFYAGARSLLVSHWPVASEATVPLTTWMLKEYEANPGQGKAEAHRKSMMALMATPDRPEYAHPLFWAPFVVVGEGGSKQDKANESRR